MAKKDATTDTTEDLDTAGLSEEERAALNDDEEGKEIQALLDEEDENSDGDEQDEEPTAQADDADDDAGEEAGEDDGKDDGGEDAKGGDELPAAGEPQPAADLAPDYTAQLAALKQKFDDGEIELSDYLDQRDAINEARVIARTSMHIAEQQREQAWQYENTRFFEEHQEYSAAKSRMRFAAMQAAIDEIGSDPGSARMSYRELLLEAKKRVDAEFGGAKMPTEQQPTQKTPAKPRLVSDRSKLPPSLKDVPAAAPAPEGGGEFTKLEGLSGMELEAAVARLTPEQQARWAEAG